MRVLTHPDLDLKLSSFGIDVPLLDQRVQRISKELSLKSMDLTQLESISQADLLHVHSESYVDGLYGDELPELLCLAYEREAQFRDLNHAQELMKTVLNQTSATHLALKWALQNQDETFFLGGGMHHAHKDFGHGFCVVNDIVIALEKERKRGQFKNAWVIDTDAHFGDGTAALGATRDWLTTFSIHQARGWPIDDSSKSLTPSNFDIGLNSAEEEFYLSKLEAGLLHLESTYGLPNVAIVVAGADAYEGDILPSSGGLNLTLEQILARDQMVYEFLKTRHIPQTWLMAGGYGSDVWRVWAQFLTWVG